MRLTVFQSDKGDCLLVTSEDGKRMLVDGGMRSSFKEHVAAALSDLPALDLVYVSHIDQDHISGVLQLVDDVVAWRVHDFHVESGNTDHREPKSPRPPRIDAIWHNAFHEQVGKNSGPIESMLAATAAILSGSARLSVKQLAAAHQDLATSVGEAIQLSRRIGDTQLNIPLNPEFDGKLMFVRDGQPEIELGSMSISVIAPFEEDLRILRTKWNQWLKDNQDQLKEIQRRAREDEGRLSASEVDRIIRPAISQADELGRRANVTAPNLASLMLLVEEDGKTLLLTGDGHSDDVLKGLEHHGKLDDDGKMHVDVLKVPHHGSENNMNKRFCQKVTADDYVFCGNGEHENPDLRIVQLIVDTRLEGEDGRSFKLWFNSSKEATQKAENKAHMREIESLVRRLQNRSGGRLKFSFLKGSSFNLSV